MSGKACSSCRYWVPALRAGLFGPERDPSGMCMFFSTEERASDMFWIMGADRERFTLVTRADFHCALWEGKTDE